jgi:glycine reductase
MVKELEKAGIPTSHICTIVPISMTVGANRIVPAVAIPHPLGRPGVSGEEEVELRLKLLRTALAGLQLEVEGPTVIEEAGPPVEREGLNAAK